MNEVNTLANNEDPDEMPHNVAFHQSLHCLLIQEESSDKEIQFIKKLQPETPRHIQCTGHKTFMVLNSTEQKFYHAHKC